MQFQQDLCTQLVWSGRLCTPTVRDAQHGPQQHVRAFGRQEAARLQMTASVTDSALRRDCPGVLTVSQLGKTLTFVFATACAEMSLPQIANVMNPPASHLSHATPCGLAFHTGPWHKASTRSARLRQVDMHMYFTSRARPSAVGSMHTTFLYLQVQQLKVQRD